MTNKVVLPKVIRSPITIKELADIGEVDVAFTATEIDDVELSPEAEEALRERYSSFGEEQVRGAIRDAKMVVLEAREKKREAEAAEAARRKTQLPTWKPLAKSNDDEYRKLATTIASEFQSLTEADHFENLKTIDEILSEIDRESKGNWRAFVCRVFWNLRFALMAAREKRIELEHRVEVRMSALEERPTLAYRGPWRPKSTYAEGSFVSMRGGVWHANESTDSKPGTDSSWTLAVKAGRDARREKEHDHE